MGMSSLLRHVMFEIVMSFLNNIVLPTIYLDSIFLTYGFFKYRKCQL